MNAPAIDQNLRLAITGAGGYLGRNLCRYFKDRGAAVFQLTSNLARTDQSIPSAHFSFQAGVAKNFFADNDINTLVHAAYDFTPRTRATIWDCNVKGSINLFTQARAEGVERITFISSMSAYDGCRSLYGQAKMEIEAALGASGQGCAVRPGLIYSMPITESGGMVGSLLNSVHRGLIPLIGKGQQELYLCHEHDLAHLIDRVSQNPIASGQTPITAANPRPYTLREIIQLLAQTVNGNKARLAPVPWKLVWAGLRLLEGAGLNPPFRSDSVLSLVHQNPSPDFSTIPDGVGFRDFAAALRNESC